MDFEILNFIQTHLRTPFLDDFFSRITHLGDAGTIWILIAVILSFTKKYRKAGVGMLIAMLVTYILGDHIIKPLAGRARPFTHRDIELLIPPPGQYSFPSGHTASSFCAAVYLFLYNKKLGIPAFVLAGSICMYIFQPMSSAESYWALSVQSLFSGCLDAMDTSMEQSET